MADMREPAQPGGASTTGSWSPNRRFTGGADGGGEAVPPPSDRPPESTGSSRSWVVLAGQVGLFALAAVVMAESLRLALWTDFGPGPGFFPFVLGAGLGLLCLTWFVQGRRTGEGEVAGGEAVPVRNAAVVLASLIVLGAVMGLLGFQLSVFGFLLFHLKWRARRGWLFSLALAVAGSVGVFTGFTQGLLVALPQSGIPALSNLGL